MNNKKIVMSEDEFNKEVLRIIFDEPIFSLTDLVEMGAVNFSQIKKMFK